MKSTRPLHALRNVAFAAITLCFTSGAAKAQSIYKGKVSLPFEARWGGAVLSAGDYTFSLSSATNGYLTFVSGQGKSLIVPALRTEFGPISSDGRLTFESIDGIRELRSLELGPLGLTFFYPIPKAKTLSPMAHRRDGMRRGAIPSEEQELTGSGTSEQGPLVSGSSTDVKLRGA